MTSAASTVTLVSAQDIQTHVALMRAFHKLQNDIQPGGVSFDEASGEVRASDAMVKYLHHAVLRFSRWLQTQEKAKTDGLTLPLSSECIPPLDVVMIWHSYMLSPALYYMDSQGAIPILASLGGIPWKNIPRYINTETQDFTSTPDQVKHWEDSTSLSFGLIMSQDIPEDLLETPKFSVDLVKAVMRQSLTITRMLKTVDGYKDEESTSWINRATENYFSFMQFPSDRTLVPPVEIDIVWHTHQLSGIAYNDDCSKYFGRVVGHNDNVSLENIRDGQRNRDEIFPPETPRPCGGGDDGCAISSLVEFGPLKGWHEQNLREQFIEVVKSMTGVNTSGFDNPQTVIPFRGAPDEPTDTFILIEYLTCQSARDFVVAWGDHPITQHGAGDALARVHGEKP